MKLEGSYTLDVKQEVVWQALNDENILKKCIPGCDSFKKESDTVFRVSATNQIGPMNATFSGSISVSNIKKNQSYTLSGVGRSSVGFANGNANVKLLEENGITTLSYEVNVNVGGKIAQLGSRLIDAVAKKMADYFFGRFADVVSPINNEGKEKIRTIVEEKGVKRVKEIKSNFLNKFIYAVIAILILLLVAIFYFVSR